VSTRRRLEALEARAMPSRDAPDAKRSDARRRMVEHLDRMARLKRGELDPEEAAEVEAFTAAVKVRLASGWGEGRR
jgi:cytochrome c556